MVKKEHSSKLNRFTHTTGKFWVIIGDDSSLVSQSGDIKHGTYGFGWKPEVKEWLITNSPSATWTIGGHGILLSFTDEKEVTLFKLFWSDYDGQSRSD